MQLKQSILGVEMRLTWGLNPLANEFQPQQSFNRLPPVSSNVITTTVITNPYSNTMMPTSAQACYQYSKTRPRAPFVDSHVGYYPPQQNYVEGNHMIPPPVAPVHNSVFYPGSQNAVSIYVNIYICLNFLILLINLSWSWAVIDVLV